MAGREFGTKPWSIKVLMFFSVIMITFVVGIKECQYFEEERDPLNRRTFEPNYSQAEPTIDHSNFTITFTSPVISPESGGLGTLVLRVRSTCKIWVNDTGPQVYNTTSVFLENTTFLCEVTTTPLTGYASYSITPEVEEITTTNATLYLDTLITFERWDSDSFTEASVLSYRIISLTFLGGFPGGWSYYGDYSTGSYNSWHDYSLAGICIIPIRLIALLSAIAAIGVIFLAIFTKIYRSTSQDKETRRETLKLTVSLVGFSGFCVICILTGLPLNLFIL